MVLLRLRYVVMSTAVGGGVFRAWALLPNTCSLIGALRRGTAAPRPARFPVGNLPWAASRPAGKRPGAFPRTPFAAPVRKINAYIAFFNSRGLRSVVAVWHTATASLAALMLGCTRLFVPSPPRRLGESLARPLRARGRPARNHRVWAAEVCGCYHRVRALTLAVIPRQRHFIFHLSSFIIIFFAGIEKSFAADYIKRICLQNKKA